MIQKFRFSKKLQATLKTYGLQKTRYHIWHIALQFGFIIYFCLIRSTDQCHYEYRIYKTVLTAIFSIFFNERLQLFDFQSSLNTKLCWEEGGAKKRMWVMKLWTYGIIQKLTNPKRDKLVELKEFCYLGCRITAFRA